MKRIIMHWTAGTNQPNSTDYQHYHLLVNGDGVVVKGKFEISANEKCRTDARGNVLYAAHTSCGNTGSIGIALCGMAGLNGRETKYPIKAKQLEAFFKKVAELCKQYNIPITPTTVLTHYEFDCNRGMAGRKIDIIYLPPYPNVKQNEVGDFIRNKVSWYLSKI